jgi:hypothetical protein
MTIDEARGRIGDGVLWLPRGGSADYAEEGTITSVSDRWAFVDYGRGVSQATDPADLELLARCGGCGCPGYCDDYVTYNLRPGETGGADGPLQAAD